MGRVAREVCWFFRVHTRGYEVTFRDVIQYKAQKQTQKEEMSACKEKKGFDKKKWNQVGTGGEKRRHKTSLKL